MTISVTYLMYWILLISLVASVLTITDKSRAKRHRRRIPERTLMTVGALGGAAVMLLCMLLIRHKTRHLKFMLGLPLMAVIQLALFLAARHSTYFLFVR